MDEKVEELIEAAIGNQEDIASWIPWIEDFRDNIYPAIFKPFGVSFESAIMIWQTNAIKNSLKNIERSLDDDASTEEV